MDILLSCDAKIALYLFFQISNLLLTNFHLPDQIFI